MSVGDSQEHDELRQVVREFLRQRSPSREVRRLMEAGEGRDAEVWAMLTGQLGLSGIAVPARYGGAGYGPVELGIVLEEMGRALLVAPYFSTVVLAGPGPGRLRRRGCHGALAARHRRRLAHRRPGGRGGIRIVGPGRHHGGSRAGRRRLDRQRQPSSTSSTATPPMCCSSSRGRPAGTGVFAVEGDAPGVERARLDALDLTRPLASVTLRDARAVRVSTGRDTAAWLSEVTDLVLAALAAEQLGGAARCLDMAVDYAKVRVQFGRPIGSFQAIKHKCADVLLEVEAARPPCPRHRIAAGGADASLAPHLPRRTARPPSPTRPRRTSRSTAASGSPGSTTRTCT